MGQKNYFQGAEGFSAQPQRDPTMKVLDFLTNNATNKDAWTFDSDPENFMRIANLLTGIMGGMGAKMPMKNMMQPSMMPASKPMMPPEFTPVGGEKLYNNQIKSAMPPDSRQDTMYKRLLEIFGGQ